MTTANPPTASAAVAKPAPAPIISPTFKVFEALVKSREKKIQTLETQLAQVQPNATLTAQVAQLTAQTSQAAAANATLTAQVSQLTGQAAQLTAANKALTDQASALQQQVTAYQEAAADTSSVQAAMEAVLSDPANADLVGEAKAAIAAGT